MAGLSRSKTQPAQSVRRCTRSRSSSHRAGASSVGTLSGGEALVSAGGTVALRGCLLAPVKRRGTACRLWHRSPEGSF